jgi:hypothetical protein
MDGWMDDNWSGNSFLLVPVEEGCDFCCFNVTTYIEFELFNY